MPRTLYGKLIAALLVLLGAISLFYVALTVVTTRLHIEEINQSLNRSLAANIVASKTLVRGREIDAAVLDDLFHTLMVINPAIEVYLLDPAGRIVAYSAPPEKVKRRRVSLQPVEVFLAGEAALPVRGDDPRDPHGRKIFSAAPVYEGGRLQGYLYVVLGGEAYESIARMFEGSYILRLGAGAAAASLVLILAAGVLSFTWLTRRLRRLTAVVEGFKHGDFRRPVEVPAALRRERGDEIDVLGIAFDEMGRRIAGQIEQLRHADGSRRELIANVSHDLRTPLASLQGAIETVLIKEAELSEAEKRRYLDLALKHCKRLGRSTVELFELATLESHDRPLCLEPFSIAELVQDVAQKFRPEAERSGLGLETDVPSHLPFVVADIGLVERVFDNLIENAIKFTLAGGTVRLSLAARGQSVVAAVADTGRGIPADALPRVFDRSYRADRERGDAPEGAGLGLTIARRILELHGSSIAVESAVGAGTTFTFELPVARP